MIFEVFLDCIFDQRLNYSLIFLIFQADFNPMFGAFKCSSPGVYYFAFTALTQPNKELRLSLRVSKINVITVYGKGPNPVTVSGSTLLHLAQDDLVYLFIEEGEINESNQINQAYTSFSGFQIAEKKSGGFFSGIIGGRSSLPFSAHGHHEQPLSSPLASFQADENDRIFDLIDS